MQSNNIYNPLHGILPSLMDLKCTSKKKKLTEHESSLIFGLLNFPKQQQVRVVVVVCGIRTTTTGKLAL